MSGRVRSSSRTGQMPEQCGAPRCAAAYGDARAVGPALAESVLGKFKERGIASIVHTSVADLAGIHGIGPSKAASILAAVELGRRLAKKAAEKVQIVHGPEDAAHYVMPHLRYEQKEHFAVLLLNTKNHILGLRDVSIGSLSASVVHPREVFAMAIRYAAAR